MSRLWPGRRRAQNAPEGRPGPPATGVPHVPEAVAAAAGLERGQRVLAGAQDDPTGHWVLVTPWRLVAVNPDETGERSRVVDRPWRDVDAGAWDADTGTLTVTWVGRGTPLAWQLWSRTGPGRVPEAFRERVQASVVLSRGVDLGAGRTARVVIRKDLRTRDLHEQVLLGATTRGDDQALVRAVEQVRRELRDQVGLPPELPRTRAADS